MSNSAPPRFIFHCGTGKTGTTSIQSALLINEGKLRDMGFQVARSIRANERNAKHRIEWSDASAPGWKALAEEAEQARAQGLHMIISNEAVWQTTPEVMRRFAKTFAGFQPQLIIYVREQVDYIQSLLLQHLKNPREAVEMEPRRGGGRKAARAPFDISDRTKLDKRIARRKLDYYELCRGFEEVFGPGSVGARLFERSAFVGGDLLVDFFTAIGVPDPSALDLRQEPSNPSIAAQFVPLMASRGLELADGSRLVAAPELRDLACRLTANGLGSRYFMTKDHVEAVRRRFEVSNKAFAATYLRNATAIPLKNTWVPEETPSPEELEAQLLDIARRIYMISSQGWHGKGAQARLIFTSGWDIVAGDRRKHAVASEALATIDFRVPFRLRSRLSDQVQIKLHTANNLPLLARVEANGLDLGELDLASDVLRLPLQLCDPLDEVHLKLSFPNGPEGLPAVEAITLPLHENAAAEDLEDDDDDSGG